MGNEDYFMGLCDEYEKGNISVVDLCDACTDKECWNCSCFVPAYVDDDF